MKILAIGFTGTKFFDKYLKREAESRGHTLDFCSASSLSADVSEEAVQLRAGDLDLMDYDVIHVGAIASNRWSVTSILGYLHKTTGCQIIDKRFVESTLDEYSGLTRYFMEHDLGLHLPRSIVFKRFSEIEDRLSEFSFPVIVKTNKSKQGKGVGFARNAEEIKKFTEAHLKSDKKVGFALREHIPNDGDYRVNVVGGKAVICLKRTPKKGEYRSNIALGGTLTDAGLEQTKEICEVAEKIVRAANYDIAGVDVMVHKESGKPYILEVNRAPSGLDEDQDVSGVNLAGLIVDLYEKRVREGQGYFSSLVEAMTKNF